MTISHVVWLYIRQIIIFNIPLANLDVIPYGVIARQGVKKNLR